MLCNMEIVEISKENVNGLREISENARDAQK